MTTLAFYRKVMAETGQTDREAMKRGSAAVLRALRNRLTPDEARQAAAQLPRELKVIWQAGEGPARKPIKMHRRDFYEAVKRDGGVKSIREARFLTLAVFGALKELLSPGEGDDVKAQLPRDLKELWAEA